MILSNTRQVLKTWLLSYYAPWSYRITLSSLDAAGLLLPDCCFRLCLNQTDQRWGCLIPTHPSILYILYIYSIIYIYTMSTTSICSLGSLTPQASSHHLGSNQSLPRLHSQCTLHRADWGPSDTAVKNSLVLNYFSEYMISSLRPGVHLCMPIVTCRSSNHQIFLW